MAPEVKTERSGYSRCMKIADIYADDQTPTEPYIRAAPEIKSDKCNHDNRRYRANGIVECCNCEVLFNVDGREF